ncbi:hypothetical protein AAG565_08365 [Fontimonas sp. SYSU GA230001]|uniref:hypothetical protein n=1 Tax=Fontimonas sp. SYSU GA230001 TaxID=3142450 RepID=UPI0032B3BB63
MLHVRYAACAALVLLLACHPARAEQDGPPTCSGHVKGQWQPLQADTMMSCLRRVDETVTEYNAQGFKFGLWGRTLLSADRYYFYSSADGGKNWQAVGLKSELTQSTDNVPPPPAGTESAGAGAVGVDAESSRTPSPAPADTATQVTPAAAAPAAAGQSPAQTLPAADRRNCSIHVGTNWKLIARLTLEECAQELDKSPDNYDKNGFKYAYWSGIFLAANATEVLKSSDSHKWELVLLRAER